MTAHAWPADTVFRPIVLDPEERTCAHCGGGMKICDHRHRRIFTLQGPARLTCKLVHCRDQGCPGTRRAVSPTTDLSVAPPGWLIGWDVLVWIGLRRFARHWSIPQLQAELRDSHEIDVSEDALDDYVQHYQTMVAAHRTDLDALREAYQATDGLVLSIDGLQPEKGHETLYVVRELKLRRVWFAEPLLSSATAEVQRLVEQARELAVQVGRPVVAWVSDKQEALVAAIGAVFPGVPHRYCHNHFLRNVGSRVLEEDRHIKVQMRRDVRGLRAMERNMLQQRIRPASDVLLK